MLQYHNNRKHGTKNINKPSSQVAPVYPSAQVHVKPLTSSPHVPSFAHGLFSQSSVSIIIINTVDKVVVSADTYNMM